MEEEDIGSVASNGGSSDGGGGGMVPGGDVATTSTTSTSKRRRGRANNKHKRNDSQGQPTPQHHRKQGSGSNNNNDTNSHHHGHIPPTPQTPQTPPAKRCDDSSTPAWHQQHHQQQQQQQQPPNRGTGGRANHSPHHNHHPHGNTPQRPPAAMTVIVHRCDLYDSGAQLDMHVDSASCDTPGGGGVEQSSNPSSCSTPPPPTSATHNTSSSIHPVQHHSHHHYNHHSHHHAQLDTPRPLILQYSYEPAPQGTTTTTPFQASGGVAVVRVPQHRPTPLVVQPASSPPPGITTTHAAAVHTPGPHEDDNNNNTSAAAKQASLSSSSSSFWMQVSVMDKYSQSIPAHLPPHLIKYWYQRRRLFHKFDVGIQLDEESWFSVSPEQIADHVSAQVGQLLQRHQAVSSNTTSVAAGSITPQWVLLDAFCGCGGNAISFAKCLPSNVLVVAVDVDRTKLKMAAHNASIYQIPPSRLCFVECNVLFVLEHVYKNGEFVLDRPLSRPEDALALMQAMPPPVANEVVQGYHIGGIDLLPRTISLVHLDPPWGGVGYQVLGKNGYDLQRNMKIQRPTAARAASTETSSSPPPAADGTLSNDFFDTFCSAPQPRTKMERKAQFNASLDDDACVNGTELLALAAAATQTHIVSYDVPRNINRGSLGWAALTAGYRGNCQLEEQYLNGRLKTVTAYFGSDWSYLLKDGTEIENHDAGVMVDHHDSNDNDRSHHGVIGMEEETLP